MKKGIITVLACSSVCASQLILFNDSAFPLTATIISATGQQLASTDLKPQQQKKWTDNKEQNSNISETPYTVLFSCKNGGEFGIAYNQPAGGLASATTATGRKYCEMKPQKRGESDVRSQRGTFQDVESD